MAHALKLGIAFLFLGFPVIVTAQERTLSGQVVDDEGDPLPYVNVFLKPIGDQGTTTNEKGRFSLSFRKGDGDSIAFRYTGYEEKNLPLGEVGSPMKVQLKERKLVMKTTTVTDGKDPGERIMDSVRAHRDSYLEGMGGYRSRFYMKGKALLDSMSTDAPIAIESGGGSLVDSASMLYLTESISRFEYYPPDRIQEEMISSRVAGDPRGFSSNRAKELLKNPYVHRIDLPGVSERGFISPLGRSSPTYYDYKWVGAYHKEGKTISKIRVTPKRKRDPVFHGTLEVVEGVWRLKALDLKASSSAPLEFVDSLRIKHEYVEWKGREWLPLSLEETYWFGMLGIHATYNMVGHLEEQKALDKASDGPSRELFRVRDSARIKDTSYWKEERSYVLEEEEQEHYREMDSIQKVRNSEPYLDSLDSAMNRLDVTDILFSGYNHQNSIDSTYWGVNGLGTAVGFNTVEGWRFRIRPYYREELSKGRSRRYALEARYGLASQRPYVKASFTSRSAPLHSERWHLEGGVTLREVNRTEPVPEWLNSVYSLTWQRNYLKLYRSRFLEASYRREWANGFYGDLSVAWEDREVPGNRTSQTWFPRSDVQYTPNRFHPSLEAPSKTLRASFDWTLWPAQRYERYPHKKEVSATPYPELYGRFEGSFPLGDDWAEYGRLELGLGEFLDLGLGGRMRVDLYGGDFLFQKEDLAIMDRKHFKGNRTLWMHSMEEGKGQDPWGSHRLRSFHTLPYYERFTRSRYGAAHVQHRFQGMILNKLPWVRRWNWNVLAGGNALYTEDQGPYAEAYIGIGNIFKVLRVDVALPVHPRLEEHPYWRVGLSSSIL